jgi:hypothetical protein
LTGSGELAKVPLLAEAVMSILSRLLKREGEGEPAPTASAETEAPGPLPAAEFPEAAEKTDRQLALRAEDAGAAPVGGAFERAAAPPPLPVRPSPSPEDVLAAHAAPLRDLMLEVRWGTAQPRWLPLARPALQQLRMHLAEETPPPAPVIAAAPPPPPAAGGGAGPGASAPPAAAAPAPAPAGPAPTAPGEAAPPVPADALAAEAAAARTAEFPLPAGLPAVLDGLAALLDRVATAANGAASLRPEDRTALLAAYQPLALLRPAVFAIDDVAERREQLIVESLLRQVPGLDPLLLARLASVGLSRLMNLVPAAADEIATVAGVPEPVAAAVVDKVAELRRSSPPGLAAEPRAARRALEPLVQRLEGLHASFERAASGWSDQDAAAKRRARRERELVYLALRTALARLGAVEFVVEIEKLPYGRRIEALGRFLRDPGPTAVSGGGMDDGRAHA